MEMELVRNSDWADLLQIDFGVAQQSRVPIAWLVEVAFPLLVAGGLVGVAWLLHPLDAVGVGLVLLVALAWHFQVAVVAAVAAVAVVQIVDAGRVEVAFPVVGREGVAYRRLRLLGEEGNHAGLVGVVALDSRSWL